MATSEGKRVAEHLGRDRVMRGLIERIGVLEWPEGEGDLFSDLVETIVNQQLSEKVGAVIFERVTGLFGKEGLRPEAVLAVSPEKMRECGLSRAKVGYIRGVSEAVAKGEVELEKIRELPDEEVIGELVKLKGVGRWSAEMMLMFSLRRPDVFSVGDLGLRTAVGRWYGIERENWEEIEKTALRWRPYRTWACRYLWRSLELEERRGR